MNYCYLNLNPNGKIDNDCVTRAISMALGKDYNIIRKKLSAIGILFDCEDLCVCCYQHLLDQVYNLKRVNGKGQTIEMFLNSHPKGTYIFRVDGHLSCGIDGTLFDIWNCKDELIDIVWKV